MFKVEAHNLYEEIEASEEARSFHLSEMQNLIRDYHGKHYRSDLKADLQPSPENHAFEWLSLVTPKVVYDAPRVNVSSRKSGVDTAHLSRLRHAMNQWTHMSGMWEQLLDVWYDIAFAYGVMRVTLGPMPGYHSYHSTLMGEIRPQMPICSRVPPHLFVIDAAATTVSEARFMGHMWRRDKDDLMNSNEFNKEAIKEISIDAGLEKLDVTNYPKAVSSPDRGEIVGYEIWVPEHDLPGYEDDPLYNGTIFTLAYAENHGGGDADSVKRSEAKWIREPRPYFGPPSGPYQLFSIYKVPGSVYPLSPLVATYDQVKELNAHAQALSKAMANAKKFVGYNPSNDAAGKAVKNAEHGDVVAIENLGDDVKEINIGWPDREMFDNVNFLRERRDRVTGLNDAARGNISGKGTATEVADAAAQRDNRLSYIERMFKEATRKTLDKVGWLMYNSEFVRFTLGGEAARELAPRPKSLPMPEQAEDIAIQYDDPEANDPFGLGQMPYLDRVETIRKNLNWNPKVSYPSDLSEDDDKSMADISGVNYEDLELVIEPLSMARTDQALLQKRAQDQFALIAQVALLMPQTPWIRWDELMARMGQANNDNDFGDVVNMETLNQIWQQSGAGGGGVPGQQQFPRPGGGESQPAMDNAADVGNMLAQVARGSR